MAGGVDTQLQLWQHCELTDFDTTERHGKKLFVQVYHVFDLLIVHYLHKLVLHISQSDLIEAGLRRHRDVIIVLRLFILIAAFSSGIQIAVIAIVSRFTAVFNLLHRRYRSTTRLFFTDLFLIDYFELFVAYLLGLFRFGA